MTTAGFVSGTRDASPTRVSRVAAASSLLLGIALVTALPVVTDVASYLGVLAASSAVVAIVTGCALWHRPTLVMRAVAAFAAAATLAVLLLQSLDGLPGARQLGRLAPAGILAVAGIAGLVLVFLLADVRRRRPEQAPDHPYAL